MTDKSAKITMREKRRVLRYDGVKVLTYETQYPEIELKNKAAERRINAAIASQVLGFERYAAARLFRQAIREYKNSVENGYPVRVFDAVLNYSVTYNGACHLSAYRDFYQFTGGAHGSTQRLADTWSLTTGRRLPLRSFVTERNYREHLISEITRQADAAYRKNPNIYFDDYRELIVSYFNENSYYLTGDGIVIYYGQYEIAPYATGIVEFTISYGREVTRPSCPAAGTAE